MRQTFRLMWEPTAKGRPRFVRGTGKTYTPSKTRNAEAALKTLLQDAGARLYPRDVPLAVEMVFWVARPRTAPKRITMPAKRPDLDQYVKLTLDGGTGLLWEDDAQIVRIEARKCFAGSREDVPTPCQFLTVWEAAE